MRFYCGLRTHLFLATFFLFAGTLASAKLIAPDWVKTGKSNKYPGRKYLVGVGSASNTGNPSKDKNTADDAAKTKLAEQIRVTVESELDSYLTEIATSGKGRPSNEVTQKVTWQVKSRVNITLEGLRFPDRHYDKKTKTYYSLAVLDRARASASRLQKAGELRQAASHYFREAETRSNSGDYGTALVYYQRVLSAVTEAIAKEREAAVIRGKSVLTQPDGLDLWNIQVKVDKIRELAKIGVHIIEKNPLDPGSHLVASAISRAFREEDFKLGSVGQVFKGMSYDSIAQLSPDVLKQRAGGKVAFLVVGEVEAKESSKMNLGSSKVYFYKSRAVVKLINVHTGEVMANLAFDYEEETKSGKPKAAQAAANSLSLAGDMLGERLVEAFEQCLVSPEESK